MKRQSVSQQGGLLIAVMFYVALIVGIIAVSFEVSGNVNRMTQRSMVLEAAQRYGEAYLESAYSQWLSATNAYAAPTMSGGVLMGSAVSLTVPSSTDLPNPYGYVFDTANFKIDSLDAFGAMKSLAPDPTIGRNTSEKSYSYLAHIDVTARTISTTSGGLNDKGSVHAFVRRVFQKRILSPWAYAIFFDDVLEIHPGPTFEVNGWVHSNQSIYACPDGGNPLTFNDQITSVATFDTAYLDTDWQWRNKSSAVGKPNDYADGVTPVSNVTRENPFGIDPSQFNISDANTNNDTYREIIERPNMSGDDTFKRVDVDGTLVSARLYNEAGVKVLVDAAGTLTVMNASGAVITDPVVLDAITGTNGPINLGPSVQDTREKASVRMVDVDVSKIDPSKIPGWNGQIYVADTSAITTASAGTSIHRGVRLKNGSILPQSGLTVVSDNPVYIQGDYNSDLTKWQPAAIMADAINIYSNAWNDANSSLALSSRTAKNTTIDVAFLSGNVPSDGSKSGNNEYSGGVENFPRFHEQWSGKTFTYRGSMVQLYKSQQSTGRWASASYGAPKRDWSFQTNLLSNPPPGTFSTVNLSRGRLYIEN